MISLWSADSQSRKQTPRFVWAWGPGGGQGRGGEPEGAWGLAGTADCDGRGLRLHQGLCHLHPAGGQGERSDIPIPTLIPIPIFILIIILLIHHVSFAVGALIAATSGARTVRSVGCNITIVMQTTTVQHVGY